jgi:hypothetical protein
LGDLDSVSSPVFEILGTSVVEISSMSAAVLQNYQPLEYLCTNLAFRLPLQLFL